jgi:hypothetical protein
MLTVGKHLSTQIVPSRRISFPKLGIVFCQLLTHSPMIALQVFRCNYIASPSDKQSLKTAPQPQHRSQAVREHHKKPKSTP